MLQNYLASNVKRFSSKWHVLLIDVVVTSICFAIAYIIRFNFTLDFDREYLLVQLPFVATVATASFLMVGSYKGVVRHTGIKDVYSLFNSICLSSIISIFFVLINKTLGILDSFTIPLSIIVIHSLVAFIALTGSRYFYKSVYESFKNKFENTKNVIIYGVGESAVLTYNALTNHSDSTAKVVGFIDSYEVKVGKNINGIAVFAPSILTGEFIQKRNIREIIITIQNIDSNEVNKLVGQLMDYPVKVKIIPPVKDWIDGELKVSQIKQIQIEDLLNRKPIQIKNSKISHELNDKVILVTGGAGSIGSELVRQIANYDYKSLLIVDQAESALYDLQQELKQNGFHNFVPVVADIRDKNRMNEIFQNHSPQIVFHAAAYKHVPLMEQNPYEAIKINIAGTKSVADLSIQYAVDKFVFISTDKAVNPTNVMGATKRIAEMYISCLKQESHTRFITTRFGNVLGSNGSVIPLFKRQIEKGGPLTVTDREVTRFFMTIPEASQLVLEAGAMGKGGEIFIFDMGESVKIFDLAKSMIKLSGLRYPEDIDIKITGLRPGEKLYEELLANGENTLPTYHKKILISKVRPLNNTEVRTKIEELCVTNIFFSDSTIRLMKEIVPEYVSNNSVFSELDKDSKKDDSPKNNEKEKKSKKVFH